MSDSINARLGTLLLEALDVYKDDPDSAAALQELSRRLTEPIRIAVAGMVKAGKSTLLNAIIGEEIAPTDTGECTRIVTWYRYGRTPRITLYPTAGKPRNLPLNRSEGRLVFFLDGTRVEDVERLEVEWPSPALRQVTLIDTPGIASLSRTVSALSTNFLTPTDRPPEADAIIYLMRHMHAEDLRFLESFRDTEAGSSRTVNALAVLSRADEVGAGRIDSLLSAATVAERYSRDQKLRKLALGVVPVAGLLAQTARTMRQSDFKALTMLAEMERPARERLLLSADRFLHAPVPEGLPESARSALLRRFGVFGIRMGVALIRGGHAEPTPLAHELGRRSGLDQLMERVGRLFQDRADVLRARTAMAGLESVLRSSSRQGSEDLASELERLQASSHEVRELKLLGTLRTTDTSLDAGLADEAEQLTGGWGNALHVRFGLGKDAAPEDIAAEARNRLHRWRLVAENPLTDRSTVEICSIVTRTCEGAIAECAAMQLV